MIVKLLMELLKALILLVLGLFPRLPDFAFMRGYIQSFVDLIHAANLAISIPVAGTCLLLIIICYNLRAVWSVIMWVVRKIPGVS